MRNIYIVFSAGQLVSVDDAGKCYDWLNRPVRDGHQIVMSDETLRNLEELAGGLDTRSTLWGYAFALVDDNAMDATEKRGQDQCTRCLLENLKRAHLLSNPIPIEFVGDLSALKAADDKEDDEEWLTHNIEVLNPYVYGGLIDVTIRRDVETLDYIYNLLMAHFTVTHLVPLKDFNLIAAMGRKGDLEGTDEELSFNLEENEGGSIVAFFDDWKKMVDYSGLIEREILKKTSTRPSVEEVNDSSIRTFEESKLCGRLCRILEDAGVQLPLDITDIFDGMSDKLFEEVTRNVTRPLMRRLGYLGLNCEITDDMFMYSKHTVSSQPFTRLGYIVRRLEKVLKEERSEHGHDYMVPWSQATRAVLQLRLLKTPPLDLEDGPNFAFDKGETVGWGADQEPLGMDTSAVKQRRDMCGTENDLRTLQSSVLEYAKELVNVGGLDVKEHGVFRATARLRRDTKFVKIEKATLNILATTLMEALSVVYYMSETNTDLTTAPTDVIDRLDRCATELDNLIK